MAAPHTFRHTPHALRFPRGTCPSCVLPVLRHSHPHMDRPFARRLSKKAGWTGEKNGWIGAPRHA
eukprot:8353958-Pyramimonas_sp.AAC.1